jgi:hypothetical protein
LGFRGSSWLVIAERNLMYSTPIDEGDCVGTLRGYGLGKCEVGQSREALPFGENANAQTIK